MTEEGEHGQGQSQQSVTAKYTDKLCLAWYACLWPPGIQTSQPGIWLTAKVIFKGKICKMIPLCAISKQERERGTILKNGRVLQKHI